MLDFDYDRFSPSGCHECRNILLLWNDHTGYFNVFRFKHGQFV